jgi:predicted metal-dependent hydrolase
MPPRDRDPEGRARNARPRDAYGRPLPYGTEGEPTTSDEAARDLARNPVAALREAQRLLDADRPFHAHEILEAVWKGRPDEERELWRALAQVAVGFTHLRRGNLTGARALLTRSAALLEAEAQEAERHGLDLSTLVRDIRALAEHPDPAAPLPTLITESPPPYPPP